MNLKHFMDAEKLVFKRNVKLLVSFTQQFDLRMKMELKEMIFLLFA
jgi:hypothetical protein